MDFCDPAESCDGAGNCPPEVVLPDGQPCDDGSACTNNDHCVSGFCTGEATIDCNDSNPCTIDHCDLTTGCSHENQPDGQPCRDGNECNGEELCAVGQCQDGVALDCDDQNPCTADSCDPVNGCVNSPVADNTSCADADLCDGAEVCLTGACVEGTALDCWDGNSCTTDSCDPQAGCQYATLADGAPCDDDDACTNDDHCEQGDCVPESAINCDDQNPCTEDTCDATGGCLNYPQPDGFSCADGDVCNGDETCQTGVCETGTAPDCSDGEVCTADSCDPQTGCLNAPQPDGTDCTESPDDPAICLGGVCRLLSEGDTCDSAILLVQDTLVTVNLALASNDAVPDRVCLALGASGPDVYFYFPALAGKMYRITADPLSNPSLDTALWTLATDCRSRCDGGSDMMGEHEELTIVAREDRMIYVVLDTREGVVVGQPGEGRVDVLLTVVPDTEGDEDQVDRPDQVDTGDNIDEPTDQPIDQPTDEPTDQTDTTDNLDPADDTDKPDQTDQPDRVDRTDLVDQTDVVGDEDQLTDEVTDQPDEDTVVQVHKGRKCGSADGLTGIALLLLAVAFLLRRRSVPNRIG